eukprot:gene54344-72618_t
MDPHDEVLGHQARVNSIGSVRDVSGARPESVGVAADYTDELRSGAIALAASRTNLHARRRQELRK